MKIREKMQRIKINGYKGNRPIEIVQQCLPTFKKPRFNAVISPQRVIAVDTESGYFLKYGATKNEKGEWEYGLQTALVSICSYGDDNEHHTEQRTEELSGTGVASLYETWIAKHRPLLPGRPKGVKNKARCMSLDRLPHADELGGDYDTSPDEQVTLDSLIPWQHLQKEKEHITLIDTTDMDYPIIALFDYLFPRYAVKEVRASWSKQRMRSIHKDSRVYRDGRRQTIEPVYAAFYNLEYDLGRLFRQHAQFFRSILTKQDDSVRIQVGPYEVELTDNHPNGNTPSIEWYIRRDGYILHLIGRDLWAYNKSGLDAFSEALLHVGKDDLSEEEKHLLFDTPLDSPELSAELKAKWRRYAAHDVQLTFECLAALILALCQISAHVITRAGMIPRSAPASAARIAFSLASCDEWNRPTKEVQQVGAWMYAGARAFTNRPGRYERIWVYDISSAYPHAMALLPNPCTVEYLPVTPQPFMLDRFRGKFGALCISGEGLDKRYPALRTHDTQHERLQYIYGRFEKIWATIPEIVIGVASGRLRVDHIHSGIIMQGSNEESFLRKFVMMMYERKKQSEKGSALYLLSKLLMNSLYGKLCQVDVNTGSQLRDFSIAQSMIFPDFRIIEDGSIKGIDDYWKEILHAYIESGIEGLARIANELNATYYTVKKGNITFGQLYKRHEYRQGKAGQYYMPLYASQITGLTSAKLGLAASFTHATNGHTDSLFCDHDAMSEIQEALRLIEQCGYESFNRETGLGSFELEIDGKPATIVKHNLYVVYKGKDQEGKEQYKLACHGITHSPHTTIPKQIEALYDKREIRYETKRTPITLHQAAYHQVEPGTFRSERRKRKVELDPNMIRSECGELIWKSYDENSGTSVSRVETQEIA
jgi:hypothetical protein